MDKSMDKLEATLPAMAAKKIYMLSKAFPVDNDVHKIWYIRVFDAKRKLWTKKYGSLSSCTNLGDKIAERNRLLVEYGGVLVSAPAYRKEAPNIVLCLLNPKCKK